MAELHLLRLIAPSLLAVAVLASASAVRAEQGYVIEVPGCGNLGDNFAGRPMDYRKASREELNRVEKFHFRDERAALLRGSTTINNSSAQGSVAGGLDYTLRVWPNHHPALAGIDRFGQLKKSDQPDRLPYTIECYFRRAQSFTPEDGVVRLLYASYLQVRGQNERALEQLVKADAIAVKEEDPLLQYNVGLSFFRLGQNEQALANAQRAYQAGVVQPELRDLLKQAGVWREPPPASLPETAASTPAR